MRRGPWRGVARTQEQVRDSMHLALSGMEAGLGARATPHQSDKISHIDIQDDHIDAVILRTSSISILSSSISILSS